METREIIQTVIDYLDDNLNAEFTVDDLCDLAGYSYVHLCRLFNLHIGMSPKEYITRRKLLFAVYEMSSGASKIDVAMNYGFNTYSGFYKAFKREFCCSPSEFIKSYIGSKPHKINILQEEHIMISKTRIKKLLTNWDLQDREVTNIINENTGRQNKNAFYIGNDYVIKYSANLASIKKTIMFADVVNLKNGDNYLQSGDLYFIITKRLKGNQLKCEDVFENPSIAYTIGVNIAKLHNKLKTFDNADFQQVNIYNDCVENIDKVQSLNQEFVEHYKNTFGKIINRLPTQVIHRDINPSNMIFNNGVFKGFIDFDLTEVNVRIFDICYCATSILSECFNNPAINKSKWLEILDNLVTGYDSINKLTNYEKQAVPYVIFSIQMICISYFSKYDKFTDLTDINIQMLKWLTENL